MTRSTPNLKTLLVAHNKSLIPSIFQHLFGQAPNAQMQPGIIFPRWSKIEVLDTRFTGIFSVCRGKTEFLQDLQLKLLFLSLKIFLL